MSALREAAQQALEALSLALSDVDWRANSPTQPVVYKAHTALEAALAEPVSADPHTTTLRNLLECCLSWERDACVLGTVTARQAVTALRAALAQPDPETMTPSELAASLKRGEKWKVIGCVGHDCEECQTRIYKDSLGNFQHHKRSE